MFDAQFFRAVGPQEKDIGVPVRLRAATLADAIEEALSWPKPEGTNQVKVLRDSEVVSSSRDRRAGALFAE